MKVAGMVKAGYPPAGGLDAKAASALIAARKGDKDFVLLDVRTPGEFSGGRIAGAVNVDFQAPDFKERLGGLDTSKAYLVHCAVGGRSKKAAEAMTAAGFGTVYDLLGGMTAWERAGLPVER
jgi:rhodanese-related sulfurtransferase